jgi:hypothetical protein
MELDTMADPDMTAADGFDLADQGITWDVVEGTPYPEPTDFDIFETPAKPDISLLTTAMAAACIEVKDIPQDAAHVSWITNDTNSSTPNAWDPTVPFVHNLANNTVDFIGIPSHDVNYNNEAFWCVQGVGAYEYVQQESTVCGICGTTSFLIFSEAIRDYVATGVGCARSVGEINQLATFHETLHLFGFVDEGQTNTSGVNVFDANFDGKIMTTEWYTSATLNDYLTLNPQQIKKIQEILYPNLSWWNVRVTT